jgi:hypothetical protein
MRNILRFSIEKPPLDPGENSARLRNVLYQAQLFLIILHALLTSFILAPWRTASLCENPERKQALQEFRPGEVLGLRASRLARYPDLRREPKQAMLLQDF